MALPPHKTTAASATAAQVRRRSKGRRDSIQKLPRQKLERWAEFWSTSSEGFIPGAAAAAAPLEHSMAPGNYGPIAWELVEGEAAAAQLPPAAPVAVSMNTDVKVPLAIFKPAELPDTVTTGKLQRIEHPANHAHAIAAIDELLCWDTTPGASLDLKDACTTLNAWAKANFGGRGIKQGMVAALLSQVYGLEIPKQANYCWLCNVSPCTKANCGTHFDIVKVKRPRCHRVPGLSFI